MIIDCISDLHGAIPELEGGDLLIVAGDLTAIDDPDEYRFYFQWFGLQKYEKVIWIAGNHDGCVSKGSVKHKYASHIEYLQDSGTVYRGFKIWGSPWTPTFQDWHFMKNRGAPIKEMWDKIPGDTDILITHGPPFGILDTVGAYNHVGCEDLAEKIAELSCLKLHVFGHIHESHGITRRNGIPFVNASIMNEVYDPVHSPLRIIL